MPPNKIIELNVTGLGIIFFSPFAVAHIANGEDYLSAHYMEAEQVQSHIQAGTIVGFGTGSPGQYSIVVHMGYPTEEVLSACDFKLRLAIKVRDRTVCVEDLYALMEWSADCPPAQMFELDDGYYHITLCSNRPPSGLIGDNQQIDAYFNKLPAMPALSREGVPMLYTPKDRTTDR